MGIENKPLPNSDDNEEFRKETRELISPMREFFGKSRLSRKAANILMRVAVARYATFTTDKEKKEDIN